MTQVRKLRLDPNKIREILDELDAEDERNPLHRVDYFAHSSFRRVGIDVQVTPAANVIEVHDVTTRKIASDGVLFLTGCLLYRDVSARIHLPTVADQWVYVNGTVRRCTYVPDTPGVYDVDLRFAKKIDVSLFSHSLDSMRVLVVDDRSTVRKLLDVLLKEQNAQTSFAEDGEEAIRMATAEHFDVILMDLEMPTLDGFEAVARLRSGGYVWPIVAVTAMTSAEDRDRCLAAGCDAYLPKPVGRKSLLDVIYQMRSKPLVSALLDKPEMAAPINDFVSDLLRWTKHMMAAFQRHDLAEIERCARTLKGEAESFGFCRITQVAAELEDAVRNESPIAEIGKRVSDLIRLCSGARPVEV